MAFSRVALTDEDGLRDIYASVADETLEVEIPIPAAGQARGFPKYLEAVSILADATNYSHDVFFYRKCGETGKEEPIDYLDFSVAANQKTSGSLSFDEGERWKFRPGDSLVIKGSVDTHAGQQVVVDWTTHS